VSMSETVQQTSLRFTKFYRSNDSAVASQPDLKSLEITVNLVTFVHFFCLFFFLLKKRKEILKRSKRSVNKAYKMWGKKGEMKDWTEVP